MQARISVGTRIYNNGDMANVPHHGTVVEITAHGVRVEIDDGNGTSYWIPARRILDRFEGHSGTRIVTEDAYKAWRAERIELLHQSMAATR